MTKKRAPKTDPWGTPLLTAIQSEGRPFTMTLSLLAANQFSIQAAILPWMPRARVDEVISHQEIDDDGLKNFSWDGGQADWSVVFCIREEIFFWGWGKRPQDVKCKGASAVVKDQICGATPSVTTLRTLGKKRSEPAALSGFSSTSTSGSEQSMSVNVFSQAWTITGSGMFSTSLIVKTLLK